MDLSGVTSQPLPSWFADIGKKKMTKGVFRTYDNWIDYCQGGGSKNFSQFIQENEMKEIREYIEENKGTPKALEDGHHKYRYNPILYKQALEEAGLPNKDDSE